MSVTDPVGSPRRWAKGVRGQWKAIAHKDQCLPSHNCSSSCRSPVGLPTEPRIEQIDHAGLDAKPGESMKDFNCPKGHLSFSHAVKRNTAGGSCFRVFRPESVGSLVGSSFRCVRQFLALHSFLLSPRSGKDLTHRQWRVVPDGQQRRLDYLALPCVEADAVASARALIPRSIFLVIGKSPNSKRGTVRIREGPGR
ncbi:hypothetical protein SRABI83_00198 [Arthrobacter sp. Bi83]|nr:hypothetical protein SRABI83_00198 [Arthrobacter sp. Bi83]